MILHSGEMGGGAGGDKHPAHLTAGQNLSWGFGTDHAQFLHPAGNLTLNSPNVVAQLLPTMYFLSPDCHQWPSFSFMPR